jgi:small-conductance mechanosensitive channel
MGYLAKLEGLLNSEALTFRILDFTLSPYKILSALFILAVFMWFSSGIAGLAERQINGVQNLKDSNKALLSKAATLAIYLIFTAVALDQIGIDLTAFTVVGGAIGIGLGFGLQKITSNFISGIILLAEKSVERNDLIELSDGTQGFVKHIGARYSLIETFDGKEVMVPNEDFVTNRVVNWTLTSTQGRVEIAVGVAYGSDIDLVHETLLEAAREHPRATKDPAPQCFLDNFGDSSINFSLYFWVEDVTAGRREPRSDVQRAIWRKFQERGIEIPFPQRDLHIKGALPTAGGEGANA